MSLAASTTWVRLSDFDEADEARVDAVFVNDDFSETYADRRSEEPADGDQR